MTDYALVLTVNYPGDAAHNTKPNQTAYSLSGNAAQTLKKHGKQQYKPLKTPTHIRQHHLRKSNAMGASITGVVVAGCFSVLVALIHTMRKENRKDHGEVQRSLGRIEQKIDGHTENHK
jgi:hypothetical protein